MPSQQAGRSPETETLSWLSRFREMPNDSMQKTLMVALLLCLVCSVVVSASAVLLKPLQIRNKAVDMQRNILHVAGLLREGADVKEQFEQIETRIVELETGAYRDDVDPSTFDQRKAARDPASSVVIPADKDIAKVKRRAQQAAVYLVTDGDRIEKIILPVHGYGLWSTLYGFLALDGDANTIKGISFYDHAETPGLGGEVDNPEWQSGWQGKTLFGEAGDIEFEVVKGGVDSGKPDAVHQVDGLAGATLTARGVMNLIRYWVSEDGFGKYLANIRSERG